MTNQIYDIIIIGAGPAGVSAAIYAARYKLKILVFGELFGGWAGEAHKIGNFLGFKEIKGSELAKKMREQLEELKVEIKTEKVKQISKKENQFLIKSENKEYTAKKIILAMGTEKRKLNIPLEKEFLGKGISYCATCDSMFYKNKTTAVVGGGNSAVTSALLLAEHADKVYIIYRRESFFRADKVWLEKLEQNPKIEIIFSANVAELIGDNKLTSIKLDTGKIIKVDGLFIELGSVPNTSWLKELGIETENNYIKTNSNKKTNIDGIYAAGDITNNPLKQIIVAGADGAIASTEIYKELMR
ncbi:FAD-dependent oxidoreductase [Candidatus Woesearchaeota archaeon]|nr:FAD-dependent oxidoreductase [Candidatus Woesearchaeota archaeon]